MRKLRVRLVEDHPSVVIGVTQALRDHHIDIVKALDNAINLLAEYRAAKPDVVVLDIRLPVGPEGIAAGRQLAEAEPNAHIVFFSQFDDAKLVGDAYKLGGLAYVLKMSHPDVLAEAIRRAAKGESWIPDDVAQLLAQRSLRGGSSPFDGLDDREKDVFWRVASGQNNEQIAAELGLSLRTISATRAKTMAKLSISSAVEAAHLAERYKEFAPK